MFQMQITICTRRKTNVKTFEKTAKIYNDKTWMSRLIEYFFPSQKNPWKNRFFLASKTDSLLNYNSEPEDAFSITGVSHHIEIYLYLERQRSSNYWVKLPESIPSIIFAPRRCPRTGMQTAGLPRINGKHGRAKNGVME